MEQIIYLALGCIIAYLLGSFSSSVWLGKWIYNIDVREYGSKNAGATNTIRVLGTKIGVLVLFLDALKAWGAVMIASLLAKPYLNDNQIIIYKIAVGVIAVLGHVFPLYTNFKGGKGVASLVGVIIALYHPLIFLLVLLTFVIIFILSRYVSLGSIISSFVFAILAVFVFPETNFYLKILAIFIAVFIPLTHHKNIKRLLNGTENKLSFKKKEITTKN